MTDIFIDLIWTPPMSISAIKHFVVFFFLHPGIFIPLFMAAYRSELPSRGFPSHTILEGCWINPSANLLRTWDPSREAPSAGQLLLKRIFNSALDWLVLRQEGVFFSGKTIGKSNKLAGLRGFELPLMLLKRFIWSNTSWCHHLTFITKYGRSTITQ